MEEEGKLEEIVNKEIPEEGSEEEEEKLRNTYNWFVGKPEEYKKEEPKKAKPQELWEKTGFYQIFTTQQKVKVQLWPEHLPYDHFKRKRAFLFV